jgi:hypothetical protein
MYLKYELADMNSSFEELGVCNFVIKIAMVETSKKLKMSRPKQIGRVIECVVRHLIVI